MVFNIFKRKAEPEDVVIPVSRIAKAAHVDEALLAPPPPPPAPEPVLRAPTPAAPPRPEPQPAPAAEAPPPRPEARNDNTRDARRQEALRRVAMGGAIEPEKPEPAAPEPAVESAAEEETAQAPARQEDPMRAYYKIPPEFWTGPAGPYLKQDLGLKSDDEWNIIALPVTAEDVLTLRTIQHPGCTFPLHAAALAMTVPLLQASFERQKEGLRSRGEKSGSNAWMAVVRHARNEVMGLADYVIQETLFKAIKREEYFPDPTRSELYLTSLSAVPKPSKNGGPQQVKAPDLSDPVTAEQYKLTPYTVVPRVFWENEFSLLMRNTLALDPDGSWNVVMLPLEVEDAVRLGMHTHPGEPSPDHIEGVRNMIRVINAEYALKSSQIGVMHSGEFSAELAELMLNTSERVKAIAALHIKKLTAPMKDLKPQRRAIG